MNWSIITQITSVVLCAMCSGLFISFLGHTPILGYILAGVILGPSGFQLIKNRELVQVLSEMGILFLLFTIGLNLSFDKIKNFWKKSIYVTLISTCIIYVLILIVGFIFKIPNNIVVLISFCVALSSTAVTTKLLSNIKNYDPIIEHSTYGILIAQDLLALIMVIIINFLPHKQAAYSYKLHNFIATMIFCSVIIVYFLKYHAHIHKFTNFMKKHNDMISIIVFGICLGSAVLSEISGLSASFGSFIAGLILGNSNLQEEISTITKPIEELLLMTFFLTVGLLVDINFICKNWKYIIFALVFVTFGKTIANIFVLRLCKFPLKESFVISVLLGNIGEFSFMLTYAAKKVHIINDYTVNFFVSLTAISLFFSPIFFSFAERCMSITHVMTTSSWEFFRIVGDKQIKHFKYLLKYFTDLKNSVHSSICDIKDTFYHIKDIFTNKNDSQ